MNAAYLSTNSPRVKIRRLDAQPVGYSGFERRILVVKAKVSAE